jgi:hypothetical protein
MNAVSLQLAREYLRDAADRGVLSVIPEAVSSYLKVDASTALAYLFYLQNKDQIVSVRAHIKCPECDNNIKVPGLSMDEIEKNVRALDGTECPDCGQPLDLASTDIYLSFFLKRRAHPGDPSAPQTSHPPTWRPESRWHSSTN